MPSRSPIASCTTSPLVSSVRAFRLTTAAFDIAVPKSMQPIHFRLRRASIKLINNTPLYLIKLIELHLSTDENNLLRAATAHHRRLDDTYIIAGRRVVVEDVVERIELNAFSGRVQHLDAPLVGRLPNPLQHEVRGILGAAGAICRLRGHPRVQPPGRPAARAPVPHRAAQRPPRPPPGGRP